MLCPYCGDINPDDPKNATAYMKCAGCGTVMKTQAYG